MGYDAGNGLVDTVFARLQNVLTRFSVRELHLKLSGDLLVGAYHGVAGETLATRHSVLGTTSLRIRN
jgi:hypothetical protein